MLVWLRNSGLCGHQGLDRLPSVQEEWQTGQAGLQAELLPQCHREGEAEEEIGGMVDAERQRFKEEVEKLQPLSEAELKEALFKGTNVRLKVQIGHLVAAQAQLAQDKEQLLKELK